MTSSPQTLKIVAIIIHNILHNPTNVMSDLHYVGLHTDIYGIFVNLTANVSFFSVLPSGILPL